VIDSKPVDVSKSVDAALTFLLKHLPPQIHLVIATREDPHLPLTQLRARGQLTEMRSRPAMRLQEHFAFFAIFRIYGTICTRSATGSHAQFGG
jgi:ATP/maltotriose-dependent transcriptional regulator MalT